jgi:uncharacterized SAM-binding protein YcdF (DUF218 family)
MLEILGSLVLPSSIVLALSILGLLLCGHRRTRGAALVSFAAAGVVLVVFSCGKTATFLLSPLEYRYPRAPEHADVGAIVVLAAYADDDANMSLSDRPNQAALHRIVEAVLLWRQCEQCLVVVSGGSPTTEVMTDTLLALGVPRERVRIDSTAGSTAASAASVRRLLGDTPFYLVTSGGHMPRSMAAFARVGLHPVPAPTDRRQPKDVASAVWTLSPFHLECSDLAVHELVGLWWYRIRGWA